MRRLTVNLLLPNQVELWCYVNSKTPLQGLIVGYNGMSLLREGELYDLNPNDPLVLKGIRLAGLLYSALLLGAVRAGDDVKKALHPDVLNNGVVSWEGGCETLEVIDSENRIRLSIPEDLLSELRKVMRSLFRDWANKTTPNTQGGNAQ